MVSLDIKIEYTNTRGGDWGRARSSKNGGSGNDDKGVEARVENIQGDLAIQRDPKVME